MNGGRPILVVEDSHEDYEMLSRVVKHLHVPNEVYRLVIGSDTLDYLNRRMGHQKRASDPLPALVLLDLHLPAAHGQEVLSEIKGNPAFRNIPVVVLSSSNDPRDIESCYRSGANAYVVKPIDAAEYQRKLASLVDFWLGTAEILD